MSWSKVTLAITLVLSCIVEAAPPVISTWYKYGEPSSGSFGISQKWSNILGHISVDDAPISTLTYTINNNPETKKNVHFKQGGRLHEYGNFNIEIDQDSLLIGFNQIEIKAKDRNKQESTRVVTINYTPDNIWSLPYTADWGAITNIQDVENIAHVVDGLWKITPDGIRTAIAGYDRAIAIGDETWASDYEVTVPFTPHSDFNGIGFAVGWQGHEGVEAPKIEWPLQALAWISNSISNPKLRILTYGGLPASTWEKPVGTDEDLDSLAIGQKYILKSHSESLGGGMSKFRVKFWKDGDEEPGTWNIEADVPTRDGSVLLVAWNADVTFGDVAVKPISGVSGGGGGGGQGPDGSILPVISNIQVTTTNSTATITWETDKPTNSVVDYGLDSNYGINANAASQTTTHSITLTGLNENASYHYRVKSADSNNNTTSSNDQVFTTSNTSSGGASSSGLVSDDFNGNVDSSVWTFYDPVGDSTLSTTETQAIITVPSGSSHDLWKDSLFAPRIRQAANNADFEVEVKFDSILSTQYQGNGIAVEQDLSNFLRFDFYSDGAVTRIFSAGFVDGVPTKRIESVITNGTPLYLRVSRMGDEWIVSYSHDGNSWTIAGTYTHSLNVSSVAIFGGNSGATPPEHTALIDYFKVNR
jgi:regulation of enolase protein 1 (concanavalin A-like superfamily)